MTTRTDPYRLRQAEKSYRKAQERAETMREQRNEAVRLSLAAGLTHAQIAEATGLTRGRIGQIAAARPGSTRRAYERSGR